MISGRRAVAASVTRIAGRQTAVDQVKRVVVDANGAGPDAYLILQFLEPRVVTENTMRRGFTPPEHDVETVG